MSLRLVDPPRPTTTERRRCNRYSISGRVTALSDDPQAYEPRHRIYSLQLINMSDSGLGALVPEPMKIGSRVRLHFPPHGPEQGLDMIGVVVRCTARASEHEIGIQLNGRRAA